MLNDDSSKGDDVESVEREARDGDDSSSYNSDDSTVDGQDENSNTLDTQSTSVSSSEDG